MPPRSRRRAASPVEAQEQDEDEAPARSLRFNQQLIGRPGKPIAVAELLKRLKSLCAELVSLDQSEPEDAVRNDVSSIARDLVHANVLGHKDKGVRVWTCCCIVEVFRIMAPDAPHTTNQLKDIFDVIIGHVIPALSDPEDPYNDQHMRILKSLEDVKSILLLHDTPNADSYMVRLFNNAFDLITDKPKSDGEEIVSKNVESLISSILATVVEESETLPVEVVELILAQFLRTDNSLGPLRRKAGRPGDAEIVSRSLPPAYTLAKTLCSTCTDRMARAISQYFSSIVVDAADSTTTTKNKTSSKKRRRDEDSDDEEEMSTSGTSPVDMKELTKAHKLLRELWRSTPECIQNVIPQLEAELAAENIDIRVLAVETTGDLISGIGAAGLPDSQPLDPVAYPSQSLQPSSRPTEPRDILKIPAAPQDFSAAYQNAYSHFVARKNDKSAQVRSAFASAIGRILLTSAGGIGLDREEGERSLRYLSELLQDGDEKVRLAVVRAVARFSFDDIVQKLGPGGGVNNQDSVLHHLVWKVRDRKTAVRTEAMDLVSKIWAVASAAIIDGDEHIQSLFGPIPSKVFETYYANDPELNQLIYQGLFDNLLPLHYPPFKDRPTGQTNGNSQRVKDSQASQISSAGKVDADSIRAERILALARDLEPRAKPVFFLFQKQQVAYAKYLEALLKLCEDYNGGITDAEGSEVKARLGRLIDGLSKKFPDPLTANEHLWKFAKKHDRRVYALIRFAVSPESDYKRVVNAIKEIKKRISEGPGNTAAMLTTVLPLVQQSAVLIYNRSHVPTILRVSRREESDLSGVAHEILREISEHHPDVFKAHVKTMCKTLVEHVPAAGTVCDDGIVQTLKACAGFAQKYPSEMPRDREMLQSMVQYALYSNPPAAAKYAVSIIISNEAKKDMYIKDIVGKCVKGFSLDSDDYLSRLAALSQIMLLAAPELSPEEHSDIDQLAIGEVLMSNQIPHIDDDAEWRDDIDPDIESKLWALKILVNRQRGYAALASGPEAERSVEESALPVFSLLRKILQKDGQISDKETPAYQKSRMRVIAGVHLLKLATASKQLDHMIDARSFNMLALLLQDPLTQVRSAFVNSLKKYLGQGRLPNRYYAMTFLLTFEPTASVKDSTLTWLRARAAAAAKVSDTSMESSFVRLLSLLTHHPDFSMQVDHQLEFAHYILFYLKAVATQNNLPMIYHLAQRCKTIQDGIDPSYNDRLYCLADIAQATIREYAELQGWQLRAWTGEKLGMPAAIFAPIKGHQKAQEIADKQYAAEEVIEGMEELVRASLRTKKRKHEGFNGAITKKSKPNGVKGSKSFKMAKTKTPRKSRPGDESSPVAASADRRRSSRKSEAKSYAGMDDSEDEDEDEDEDMDLGTNGGEMEEKSDAVEEEPEDMLEKEDPIPAPATKKGKKMAAGQKMPLRGAGKKVTRVGGGRSTRSRREVVEVEDDGDEGMQDEDE
ncbi:hypothetical protein CAC42_7106 [Sphaceloma murrayae]|uniref:Sister chromatid cohesion protein pds5 n=1 Tax=Sphaceloma murrayae TaxID=2082308 RepID=A0A2K1QRC8_9PEZI|nr:hypothetical protein CAC42_7106 [Sphaceloma murrayae]